MCKKITKITILFLKLMSTNVRIPQKILYNQNFKFWCTFLFLEKGTGVVCYFGVYCPTREVNVWGFVVKLVAAELIRPHIFFFTLSYFVDNKPCNEKKRYNSFSP